MATNSNQVHAKPNEIKWTKLISKCQSGDASVKDFCKGNGISTSAYYYWQKHLKQRDSKTTRLVEIKKPKELSVEVKDQHPDIVVSGQLADIERYDQAVTRVGED